MDAAELPSWDLSKLSIAPEVFPSELVVSPDPEIRALFFEGVSYRGQPTRVFAWMGIPRTDPGKKAPGMVLLHGGMGTAFRNWVRLWMDRGYAAIAIDTCGSQPYPEADGVVHPRHDFSGPPGWGGFDQIDEDLRDQWTYHAVAGAILANSLLRSQPGVDADRIGLTGISWGGYLTCIAAAVDSRFRLAAPIYGCGFSNDHDFAQYVQTAGEDRGERWMKWWDPSRYIDQIESPVLWLNGSNDPVFWLPAWQKSYRLTDPSKRFISVPIRMPHGHAPMSQSPAELLVFVDSVLQGEAPLIKVVSDEREGSQVRVSFAPNRPLEKAELNYTTDATSPWPERYWESVPCSIAGQTVTGELPRDAKFYYVNLFDDRECIASSEHAEVSETL